MYWYFLLLYGDKLIFLNSLLKTFYFIYIFNMVVKKTVAKKPTKKAPAKHVSASKVVETKKPTVIVETKKTDRCECESNCNCGKTCCCACGLGLKIVILLLVIANLVVSCLCLCPKKSNVSGRSAWDLEALKVWWEENLEKLKNDLYWSEAYKAAQKESIDSYLQSLWIE